MWQQDDYLESSMTATIILYQLEEQLVTIGVGDYVKATARKVKSFCLLLFHRPVITRHSSHDTGHVYSSIEHICALLSDDSPPVILQCLDILNILLQRYYNKFRSMRARIIPEITDRLVELAHG